MKLKGCIGITREGKWDHCGSESDQNLFSLSFCLQRAKELVVWYCTCTTIETNLLHSIERGERTREGNHNTTHK